MEELKFMWIIIATDIYFLEIKMRKFMRWEK